MSIYEQIKKAVRELKAEGYTEGQISIELTSGTRRALNEESAFGGTNRVEWIKIDDEVYSVYGIKDRKHFWMLWDMGLAAKDCVIAREESTTIFSKYRIAQYKLLEKKSEVCTLCIVDSCKIYK